MGREQRELSTMSRNMQKKRAKPMMPIRRLAPTAEKRTRTCVILSTFRIMRTCIALLTLILHAVTCAAALAQTELTVLNAQPTGEIAQLAQAAEVRVRFSEPMVTLGRMPDEVTVPFFSIAPTVAGTFRWAGPTILVFTPNPKTPLPNATRYQVTIGAGATAVSGRKLARPYTFACTTPTVRLLSKEWYRRNNRYDQPILIPIRFNQQVRAADVVAHISLRYQRHDWERPVLTPQERTRMGAEAARFDAKVNAAV